METKNNRCALFVANRGFCLATDCELIFRHLEEQGWDIVIATGDDDWSRRLEDQGLIFEQVRFNRGGFSPYHDFDALRKLVSIHRRYRPALVQHFNSKPIILDALAAALVHKPRMVNTITGLGHAFIKGGPVRPLAILGYRLLGSRSDCSIFLNPDDMELFNGEGWIPEERSELIVSPGVDCNRYRPEDRSEPERPVVLLATRLLWQKGVREFVDAARIVSKACPEARVQLAGDWDHVHPDAVDRAYVEQAVADGVLEFAGFIDDMQAKLLETSMFVLPSYREGVPRVLLEAMASGTPVITTDVPGCRAAVRDGETGLLVPPRDADALAQAMIKLIGDAELRRSMSRKARRWCEESFDIGVVNRAMVDVYRRIGIDVPPLVPRDIRSRTQADGGR